MASEKDLEKMEGHEEQAAGSASPTVYEKLEESERPIQETSGGYPDLGHEEVEELDAGHQADLARQRVRYHPTKI